MLSLFQLTFEEVLLVYLCMGFENCFFYLFFCVWKVPVPKFNCNKSNQTDPALNTRVLVFFGQIPVGLRVPGA